MPHLQEVAREHYAKELEDGTVEVLDAQVLISAAFLSCSYSFIQALVKHLRFLVSTLFVPAVNMWTLSAPTSHFS